MTSPESAPDPEAAPLGAGVFDGVRILDFGRYIAGPYCAALLGDLGADVIRIEPPGGAEDRSVYPVGDDETGALFLQVNRNKRSLTLDLKAKASRDILHRLVKSSNVVVANLPHDALSDLGLDYAALSPIRPGIILTSISAFGNSGPFASRVGFDGVGQAMSGAAYMSGFDTPTRLFTSWVDFMSASLAALNTAAALHEQARSGRGGVVEASLLNTALMAMNFPIIEEKLTGVARTRTGNRGQAGGPNDIFRTKDGWIISQTLGQPMFKRWVRLVDRGELLEDARFASDAARAVNGEALSQIMGAWCADKSNDEALTALAKARVPAGPVLSPREALAHPHVQAAGLITPMIYPGLETIPIVLPTMGQGPSTPAIRRPPPRLGQHTEEVLQETGFSTSEIAAFRSAGVI